MEFFPEPREHSWPDDRAPQRHVRIQISYVVDVRLAFEQGDDRAKDALKRRIGHRHDGIAGHKKRARDRQCGVAEVIRQAVFHTEARKVSRTCANYEGRVGAFRLKERLATYLSYAA